jgi:hypothetical protein
LERFNEICVGEAQVNVITLDEYLANEGISRIHLMKVDIEAHEFHLIEFDAADRQPSLSVPTLKCLLDPIFQGVRYANQRSPQY